MGHIYPFFFDFVERNASFEILQTKTIFNYFYKSFEIFLPKNFGDFSEGLSTL